MLITKKKHNKILEGYDFRIECLIKHIEIIEKKLNNKTTKKTTTAPAKKKTVKKV